MTSDPKYFEAMCVTLPKDHCVQVSWKYIKACGYSDLFSKPWTKSHWPLDGLWPQVFWGHMCDSTQGSLCPSLMKIHQSVWIQRPFFKNLNQRSLTPRWPLTSCLLRSHVWLYPRVIVSKSHGNTSMFVDTMINFAKYHILHTTYIHTYYILHTYYVQNEWSHSLFLNTFRRDKNDLSRCPRRPLEWIWYI